MIKLSVIVPCFNCERTLEASVQSVLEQESTIPFDITMVDDGSTDQTFNVMQRLARQHPRITILRHDTNLGGGAARNTAVAHSDGDLIFCVDGDDLLGAGFLENMTQYWQRVKCDALGMSTSVKFRGMNISDVAYINNYDGPGKPVRFESFLDGSDCSLSVVFLMTRAAFKRIGGYPIEHGFDTQGMGFRILCYGLRAYTCPDTVYYHRVGQPQSYYKREQRAGRINWNWFNVFDEFLYIFSNTLQVQLLENDLFEVPEKPPPPSVIKLVRENKEIYQGDYRRLVRLGPDGVAKEFTSSPDPFKQYWLGNFHRFRNRHSKAISHYARALSLGLDRRIIYYRMLQAELGLSGASKNTARALDDLILYSRPFPANRKSFQQRMFHRIMEVERLRGTALAVKHLKDHFRDRKSR